MADVPTVTIVDGIPTAGTGTVQTISTTNAILGEVQASPTANTLADRLKTLNTSLTAWDKGSGTGGTVTQRVIIDNSQIDSVAHDAADAGSPGKIGAKATTSLSGLTLVADADRTNLFAGIDGVLILRPHCNLEDIVSGTASNTDGTSTEVIAAAAAGIKQYLTHASFSNTHATTSVMVALKSATTSRWRVNVPPGGREVKFDPPLKPNAAAEAWNFDPDSAVTTIECSLNGFKSKV